MEYVKKYPQIPLQVEGLNIFEGKEITLLILDDFISVKDIYYHRNVSVLYLIQALKNPSKCIHIDGHRGTAKTTINNNNNNYDNSYGAVTRPLRYKGA